MKLINIYYTQHNNIIYNTDMSIELEATIDSNSSESIIECVLQLLLLFGFVEISRQGGPTSIISSLLMRKRGVSGRML